MKVKLEKLFNDSKIINERINKTLTDEIKKLINEVKSKNLNVKELREELSELIRGSGDIILLYRIVIDEARKQNLSLDLIKEELAKRLVLKAKRNFLFIEIDDLNEAMQLYKEIKLDKQAQNCKDLIENMFAISEDNKEKLNK